MIAKHTPPDSTALSQWPCDQALRSWELTAECDMRAEHAVDDAMARIAGGLLLDSETEALLAAPLPAEPGEPGYAAEVSVPRASGVDTVEQEPPAELHERTSAVVPMPTSSRGLNTAPTHRRLLLGGFGLVLASAAAVLLWVRGSSQPESATSEPLVFVAPALVEPDTARETAQTTVASAVEEEEPTRSADPLESSPNHSGAAKQRHRSAHRTRRAASADPAPVALAPPSEPSTPKPGMKPAAEQGTPLEDRPSPGDLHASMAKVLPTAGRCLAAGQSPVPVSVTFLSAGGVAGVAPLRQVSAAEQACVISAMSQARVPPFARPTYRIEVTVRSSQ